LGHGVVAASAPDKQVLVAWLISKILSVHVLAKAWAAEETPAVWCVAAAPRALALWALLWDIAAAAKSVSGDTSMLCRQIDRQTDRPQLSAGCMLFAKTCKQHVHWIGCGSLAYFFPADAYDDNQMVHASNT
jgi:hypothetical protein